METDIQDFLLDRRVKHLAPKTLAWYKDCAGRFQKFCATNGIYRTSDINARALRLYLAHLEEAGHNPGGISNLYRPVRTYLKWCSDEFGLPQLRDALRKVPPPKVSDDPLEPIALDSVSVMIAQCTPRTFTGERDKALLYMLLDTGIRKSEITALTVDDLNLETGSVLVREGKGGKSRTVFIGAKARRALMTYLRYRDTPLINFMRRKHGMTQTDALWLTDEGTPITSSGLRNIVARRARQAGLPEPGLHEFRRAFAVNSLRNGMDVVTLQRLLGHSTLAVINRYLKLVSDDLKKSHEKFGVVDRL